MTTFLRIHGSSEDYRIIFWNIKSPIAATEFYGFKISPSDLRQKTDAIMANGAIKILKIENSIASELNSQYKTMHLLCKSFTVEALDRSNLDVLSKIGKQVNHRGILENINPNLK